MCYTLKDAETLKSEISKSLGTQCTQGCIFISLPHVEKRQIQSAQTTLICTVFVFINLLDQLVWEGLAEIVRIR